MSKKQQGAAQGGKNVHDDGARPGRFERFRSLPGFRTALVAFVLTVVLGAGSTVAYAYWSQSTPIAITGSTRATVTPTPTPTATPTPTLAPTPTPTPTVTQAPPVPAGTTLVTLNQQLLARPATPSGLTCSALLTHEQMKLNNFTDIRFSWLKATGATKYVVTIRASSNGYSYDQTKTVSAENAEFTFKRLESDSNGNAGYAAFYTRHTVRVMPMNGNVPGDPLYWTLEYAHQNSANCYDNKISTGASPVGSVAPVQCTTPVSGTGAGGYSDLTVNWARADKATSYSVRMLNSAGYGAETTVSTTSTIFRVPRVSPESGKEPYFSDFTVRVQPMQGNVAGDPAYITYRWGPWHMNCGW